MPCLRQTSRRHSVVTAPCATHFYRDRPMLRFLLRRLLLGLAVALTVMTLAFMLTRLSGDLAISIAGANATQADVEIIRKAYGLDRPLALQFFDWIGARAGRRFRHQLLLQGEGLRTLIAERTADHVDARPRWAVAGAGDLDPARHPRGGAREHLDRPRPSPCSR